VVLLVAFVGAWAWVGLVLSLYSARERRKVEARKCSHWPRVEVRLSDETVAAYICARCGESWHDAAWVAGE
jgi:hypothetical protein